jgi:valyl-tRNA synthetase
MPDAVRRFRSVDPETLPKHFDAAAAERRWDEAWQRAGLYHWDPRQPREATFVVDTPPPTASGSLHPGHMFSYTHTDILVRHQRMRGRNVFYPMGWDDNGLPTERRVQNHYHVRCDPTAPYEPGLHLEPAPAKPSGPPRRVSRPNFIELCERVTTEDEQGYKELWRRLGISVDWRLEYRTVDAHCRRIAQLSFRDLFEKGHVYTSEAPTMWDVDFQCAIAQAEAEDRPRRGAFHDLEFGVEGSERSFTISTTRPELLAACVGVTAHPDDARHRDLFGRRAVTPLFRVPVPIFPSELADPEKGTGILMVCTFGDATDVLWWRDHGLALRQLVGRDGRLAPLHFGAGGVESLDPEAANRFYAELAGKSVEAARRRIVELLALPEGGAAGPRAPLRGEPRPIEHTVKFYEKGERPLEFVPTRQWFVRLLDKKPALLAKGHEVRWHPPFMVKRFDDWTENLAYDWCVSRQRFFGVPIPVWFPLDARGEPDYASPIVAGRDPLPVDPTTDAPPGFREDQRDRPGGFRADPDIFDTWFTSSLTPQINSHWLVDPARHAALFPADVRPQAHDIIRTWAFYTIAKALLHEDRVPWRHAAISGWILDPDRKKMSKSKGNVVTPIPLIEQHGADAIRYWAGCARLGVDTALDEQVYRVGKRLVTKVFNAGKFVLGQGAEVHPIACELDRAFAAELRALVARATAAFDGFDQAQALQETESFFWQRFTDTYLELAKARARGEGPPGAPPGAVDEAARGSAVATLRLGLSVLLRLLAPTLPYVTEEVWSWAFAEETGHASIHRAPWPDAAEFEAISAPAEPDGFAVAVAAYAAIHKAKADAEVSAGREVLELRLAANGKTLAKLAPVLEDVLAAARARHHALEPAELADGVFEVRAARFAERAP